MFKSLFRSLVVMTIGCSWVLVSTGCEPLHRDIPVFGDEPDATLEDVSDDDASQCQEGLACGPCGLGSTVCVNGLQQCSGPVDLQTDDDHCGECDNSCGAGASCVGGTCVSDDECIADVPCGTCGTGVITCSVDGEATCVGGQIDLDTDPDFCGDCDTSCDPGSDCVDGVCVGPPPLRAIACPQQVTLIWDEIPGSSSYEVRWSSSPGGADSTIPAREGNSGIVTSTNQISLDFNINFGTLYFQVTGRSGGTQTGNTAATPVSLPSGTTSGVVDDGDELTVPEGETYVGWGDQSRATRIQVEGTLCVERLVSTDGGAIRLRAPQVEVGEHGAISATASGHGGGGFACTGSPGDGGGGGSYGGAGDATCDTGGGTYGDATSAEIQMGSGGGGTNQGSGPGGGGQSCGVRSMNGGRGGGALHLEGAEIRVAGVLVANGSGTFGNCPGHPGGSGSGGGILLEGGAVFVNGTAELHARGGALGKAGGGGRIKLLGDTTVESGALLSAAAGTASAADGSVYVE